jgi:hypothetical protein
MKENIKGYMMGMLVLGILGIPVGILFIHQQPDNISSLGEYIITLIGIAATIPVLMTLLISMLISILYLIYLPIYVYRKCRLLIIPFMLRKYNKSLIDKLQHERKIVSDQAHMFEANAKVWLKLHKEAEEEKHKAKLLSEEIKVIFNKLTASRPLDKKHDNKEVCNIIEHHKDTNGHNAFILEGMTIPKYGRLSLDSKEWKYLRKYCAKRDGGKRCIMYDGNCYGPMQLHHKILISEGGTNEPSNLEWRCEAHHSQEHPHMIKALLIQRDTLTI